MTDGFGYSVEIDLTRSDEGAALCMNCRKAMMSEVTSHADDPKRALSKRLEGMRSF